MTPRPEQLRTLINRLERLRSEIAERRRIAAEHARQ
jgi:uncharacterized protein (UPF0335 family)